MRTQTLIALIETGHFSGTPEEIFSQIKLLLAKEELGLPSSLQDHQFSEVQTL